MSGIEYSHEFDSISPYTDEEAVRALGAIADHPMLRQVSKFMFPAEESTFLSDQIKNNVHSINDFQMLVMQKFVYWVLDATVDDFSYDGIEHIKQMQGKFLALSNHRDIILDPAITQVVLHMNDLPLMEIAVGDNLLSNKYLEYLIRSNRMIKVIRGIDARSLYLSSQLLSKYIRYCITSGRRSVWLAQREGRAKDGLDSTEQGLLKMLDMSGVKGFTDNFDELNIVPLSISYEYEPCDVLKARELLISRTQKYVKGKYEDMVSIMTGIKQHKGNVHLNIGRPLDRDEIEKASVELKNDRYQAIRHAVDQRVIDGYRLWKTNYMAYDLLHGVSGHREHYTPDQLEEFKSYTERQLDTVEPSLNRDELRQIFWSIYSNPVAVKER